MRLIEKRNGRWELNGIVENINKDKSDVYFKNLGAVKKNPDQKWEAKHDIGIFIDDDEIFTVLTKELGFDYGERSIDIREDGEVVGSRDRRFIKFRVYPALNPRMMLVTPEKNQPVDIGALTVLDATRYKDITIKFHVYSYDASKPPIPTIDEFWGTVDESDDDTPVREYGGE